MSTKSHWEEVYQTKASHEVSWYQTEASLSLDFIQRAGLEPDANIIDVGGGSSILVDGLIKQGYRNLIVLDISGESLAVSRERLGNLGEPVQWLEADITQVKLPPQRYDLWHDRAVFHFLTTSEQRQTYVRTAQQSLKPDGQLIIATFAPDGPLQCSNLTVAHYDPTQLAAELGTAFSLIDYEYEAHRTPWGSTQSFVYCRFRLVRQNQQ
ncbi:MAG: class I SAM-dependent methyltransferase [Chloroflexota bacterium]